MDGYGFLINLFQAVQYIMAGLPALLLIHAARTKGETFIAFAAMLVSLTGFLGIYFAARLS